jgi:prepilin-type N-terminal cleavage/methylation domain-containing protein
MMKKQGFTLIELVMVIVLLGILAVGGASLMSMGFSSFFKGRNIMEADWQGRVALERMGRDLRAIRSASDITLPTQTGQNSANTIIFTNLDGNQITYDGSSGNNILLNTQILADSTSLNLTYYDAAGSQIVPSVSVPYTNVKYIVITLTITYRGANFTITKGIYPWNFF